MDVFLMFYFLFYYFFIASEVTQLWNDLAGDEHHHWLALVDAVAQSGGFHEEEIAWLWFFVSNGQEHEATAYLRHIIAERHYAYYHNSVFVEDNLDSAGEDHEADDELSDHIGVYRPVVDHPPWSRHHGPPDIFDRASDTGGEDEAPVLAHSPRPVTVGSSRWLRFYEASHISNWEIDTEDEDPASRARDQDGGEDERGSQQLLFKKMYYYLYHVRHNTIL